jgi:hypothetical protein
MNTIAASAPNRTARARIPKIRGQHGAKPMTDRIRNARQIEALFIGVSQG